MSFTSVRGKLIDSERVIKEWSSNEWTRIIATNHRIFLMRDKFFNKQSVEAPYSMITSLELYKRRPRERLLAATIFGIIFMGTSYLQTGFNRYTPNINIITSISSASLIFAVGLFIWFLIGVDSFTIHINGRDPIYISKELEELYYLARLHLNDDIDIAPRNEDLQLQDTPHSYVRRH